MNDYQDMMRCLWKGVADTDQQQDALQYIEELEERNSSLETLIKDFFTLLDITEQTDEGRLFRPNRIYSRRALDAEKLNQVLLELKRAMDN